MPKLAFHLTAFLLSFELSYFEYCVFYCFKPEFVFIWKLYCFHHGQNWVSCVNCAVSVVPKTTFPLLLKVGYFQYDLNFAPVDIRSRLLPLPPKLFLSNIRIAEYVHYSHNCFSANSGGRLLPLCPKMCLFQ